MKRITSLGTTVGLLLALGAVLAATTMAATQPNILPEGTATEPVTAITSAGEAEFGLGLIRMTSKKAPVRRVATRRNRGALPTSSKKPL
jgi:hypothetical protein